MFCWRGDVLWKIATEPSPKDLSHVDSNEFILAIPDFTKEPIATDDFTDHENSFQSSRVMSHDRSRNAVFRKVIMKLNGGVRWIAGLVLERRCPPNCLHCEGSNKCRFFNFIPHYDVHLKRPEFCCHETREAIFQFVLANGRFTIATGDFEATLCTAHCRSLVRAILPRRTGTIQCT